MVQHVPYENYNDHSLYKKMGVFSLPSDSQLLKKGCAAERLLVMDKA